MIVICWSMLPVYAARAIGAFVRLSGAEVRVLRVPSKRFSHVGTSEMTGCPVIDVESGDQRTISEVVGEVPEAIVAGGWANPCFIRWAKEVRRHGGRTIVTSDEAFTKKSFKQFVRKWRFRLLIAPLFDKVFVVGEGGKKHFIDYYGLSPERVFTGLYGSDPNLFFNGPPLKERPKRFIYVGHYDANKNVLAMCTAFEQAVAHLGEAGAGWTLDVYGGGELEGELKKRESTYVHVHGFIQAEQLGPLYRDARGFVLGSFSDKWGVVVHEAAASGCLLLLSTAVGAHYDFARPENAALFDPASVEAFQQGFEKLMTMPEDKLDAAQALSVQLAQGFSPEIFAQSLMAVLR